jgi:hypothetical protein
MPLNQNALCSLDDLKAHLDIPISDLSQDSRLTLQINTSSELIARRCDRVLVFKSFDLRRDGRRADRILLPQWPVVSVQAVWDDPQWDFLPGTELPSTSYSIQNDDTLVLRGSKFNQGTQNIRVQFTAGYQSPVTLGLGEPLPESLKYACLVCSEWLGNTRHSRRIGVQSKSKQNESQSFSEELPPMVGALIAEFVRFEVPNSDSPIQNG